MECRGRIITVASLMPAKRLAGGPGKSGATHHMSSTCILSLTILVKFLPKIFTNVADTLTQT